MFKCQILWWMVSFNPLHRWQTRMLEQPHCPVSKSGVHASPCTTPDPGLGCMPSNACPHSSGAAGWGTLLPFVPGDMTSRISR